MTMQAIVVTLGMILHSVDINMDRFHFIRDIPLLIGVAAFFGWYLLHKYKLFHGTMEVTLGEAFAKKELVFAFGIFLSGLLAYWVYDVLETRIFHFMFLGLSFACVMLMYRGKAKYEKDSEYPIQEKNENES